MIAAVNTFNGAGLYFRAELFIVTAIIAWTYLHHTYFRRLGIDYRHFRNVDGVKQVVTTDGGAERYWELSHCLKQPKCPLTKGMIDNLAFLIELRHEIEHRSTSRVDDAVSTERMTEEERLDPHFAFRVNFTPVLANRPAGADQVIEFSKATPEVPGSITYVKTVEPKKYRPGQIVDMMQADGYGRFKMHHHTELWQTEKAKDPKLGYGSPLYGTEGWGWNDKWLAHVRDHCAKNDGHYGRRVKQPEATPPEISKA